ncbi:nSTAND3 domain-containing NTPase [Mesorhizobium sp. BHbdii]
MTYDFSALSYADFEDLSRDLIGKELGIRFEAFAPGPDGGMDGRHAAGGFRTVLQSKHYAGTRWSGLKKAMKKERASIDRLTPNRYILTTSCPLSPENKAELAGIIGPALKSEDDIFGPGDLNSLLRKHPEIVKSHIKLWLSGTAVLERVLHAALHSFNDITRDEIVEKVRVYAPNPSFNAAQDILEKQHVLIISGPPGVGKTTLAEMLCYAHLGDGWELKAIRQLDDGLTTITDKKKQIFYFDDFLGRVALDKNALSKMDSHLARFITRVRKSPNARFILTTRAPIFEEAKRHSEHLADRQLDISRYLLDVGVYTRRIKARILYNHLLVTGTPQTHINTLIDSGKIASIVDHKNYSPRLIALMTEGARVADYTAEDYPAVFLAALDNPTQLWDIPFRKHIPTTCRHLLMTLFFCSEFGVQIERLRAAYASYHRVLSDHYGASQDPKDFEESLKILEGGFIKIVGTMVSFVNPSVRDYLQSYLDDYTLLTLAAQASVQSEWAQRVWEHGKRLATARTRPMPAGRAALARAFLPIARAFLTLPVWLKIQTSAHSVTYTPTGLSNVERVELMIDWWYASADDNFLPMISTLAGNPVDGWDAWRDADNLLILVGKLRGTGYFDELPQAADLADILEEGAANMIDVNSLTSEDLDKLSDAYEEWRYYLGPVIKEAIASGIRREFEEIDKVLRDMDSESTVDEHIEVLEKLGKRTGISEEAIKRASEKALERKIEIESDSTAAPSSSVRSRDTQIADAFDDAALQTLFAPLRRA